MSTQKQKLTILRLSQELAGGDFCHILLVKASHMSKAYSRGEDYMSVNREVYLFGNLSITDFHNPLNGCLLAIHKGQAESRCNGRPHRHRLLKCSECRGPGHCWVLRQVPLPVWERKWLPMEVNPDMCIKNESTISQMEEHVLRYTGEKPLRDCLGESLKSRSFRDEVGAKSGSV